MPGIIGYAICDESVVDRWLESAAHSIQEVCGVASPSCLCACKGTPGVWITVAGIRVGSAEARRRRKRAPSAARPDNRLACLLRPEATPLVDVASPSLRFNQPRKGVRTLPFHQPVAYPVLRRRAGIVPFAPHTGALGRGRWLDA